MLAFEKVLDSFTIDTLYKPVRAMNVCAVLRKKIQ